MPVQSTPQTKILKFPTRRCPLPATDLHRLAEWLTTEHEAPPDLSSDFGRALVAALKFARSSEPQASQTELLRRYLSNLDDGEAIGAAILKVDPASTVPNNTERRTAWTHAELMAEQFPAQRWLVEDLIPDAGLTVLGGKRKLGKSWLCLQIAQCVACGTPFLAHKTTPGRVLYFALEDGAARLQRRLRQQRSPEDLPVLYRFELDRQLDNRGIVDLDKHIEDLAPQLVIVDTLAAAKSGRVDENEAGPMSDIANELRQTAQRRGVGIILVHHHGKASRGDVGDDLRGSSTLAAAADLTLGLYRGESGFTLKAEGRDIAETELRVRFDGDATFTWQLVGDARLVRSDEADQEVIEALRELGRSDVQMIAKHISKARPNVQKVLKRLVNRGLVNRTEGEKKKVKTFFYELSK